MVLGQKAPTLPGQRQVESFKFPRNVESLELKQKPSWKRNQLAKAPARNSWTPSFLLLTVNLMRANNPKTHISELERLPVSRDIFLRSTEHGSNTSSKPLAQGPRLRLEPAPPEFPEAETLPLSWAWLLDIFLETQVPH